MGIQPPAARVRRLEDVEVDWGLGTAPAVLGLTPEEDNDPQVGQHQPRVRLGGLGGAGAGAAAAGGASSPPIGLKGETGIPKLLPPTSSDPRGGRRLIEAAG